MQEKHPGKLCIPFRNGSVSHAGFFVIQDKKPNLVVAGDGK